MMVSDPILLFPLLLGFDILQFQKLVYIILFTKTVIRLIVESSRYFKLKYYDIKQPPLFACMKAKLSFE